MKKYYIDQIDGFENVREYSEIIADCIQNADAANEKEAKNMVAKAIEEGELIEVDANSLDPDADEQYRQDGDYVEIRIFPAGKYTGPEFWVDFSLNGNKLERGELHHEGPLTNFWKEPEIETVIVNAAVRYAAKYPICVTTSNETYGDPAFFVTGSVEKLTAALQESEYELPEDGLQEGRDWRFVIG